MVFETKPNPATFKIPSIERSQHVYFGDLLGTPDTGLTSPLVGSWFRIESGPAAPPPTYEYDEAGVVYEGSLTLRDEQGNEKNLVKGDTFFIHRGSTIEFSSSSYALCFKCGARLMAKF